MENKSWKMDLQYENAFSIYKKFNSTFYKLTIVINKTYESKNLPLVSNRYYNDMIRGFFDGDGSIYKNGEKGFTISFSSNKYVLNNLKNYFNNLGIKTSNIRLRNKKSEYSAMLEVRGNNQIIKLKSLLYNEENIFYLKRKYNKFLDFDTYISQLKKRNFSEEVILEIKNLFLNGKSRKEIHILTGLKFNSVRTVIQRLKKNGEI